MISAKPSGKVLANLLVATNGATTKGGRSAPLSPVNDRRRFHAIRSQARALVIGGNTYRHEPYTKTSLPLYIATHQSLAIESLAIESLATESLATAEFGAKKQLWNKAPLEVVNLALAEQGSPILIEGGVRFVEPLIRSKVIDVFYITRSPEAGDGDYFDETDLRTKYHLTDTEIDGDLRFEVWLPE